jgi:hypothetical protein
MRARFFLASLCALLLLAACVTPSMMVKKEGDRTVVVLGGAEFAVPPGFEVIETERSIPSDTVDESMVVMARSERKHYTVIVFSRQRPVEDGVAFVTFDIRRMYPDALFYDEDLGCLHHAATYVARMPMARRLYFEEPLCKVLTGYQYAAGGFTRYKFDVYQNFAKEDPLSACCGKRERRPLPGKFVKTAQKSEVESFRKYALALIKENIRWP